MCVCVCVCLDARSNARAISYPYIEILDPSIAFAT
jgi:hypothetical protein